jgi:hypothetical protein
LIFRVLEKKANADGQPAYEFLPGSWMYGLMLRVLNAHPPEAFIASGSPFVAMLPFIFPPVKPVYAAANPGVLV